MNHELPILKYFDEIYFPARKGQLTKLTIAEYRKACSAFVRHFDDLPIGTLTPELVAAFVGGFKRKMGNKYRSAILSVYRHACPQEYAANVAAWRENFPIDTTDAKTPDSLRWFFREVYKPLRLNGMEGDGARLHEISLNNYRRFLGREATCDDLTSEMLAKFFGWLKSRDRAIATIIDNRNRLFALARFAHSKGLIDELPEVAPMVEPERAPRAWTEEDLEKLFAACAAQKGLIGEQPASTWWLALHLVCYFTGERIGAVLSLRWSQVDFDRSWLMLRAEQRKGKRRDKEWRLPEIAVNALRKLRLTSGGKLVFPMPFTEATLYSRYRKLLDGAGLPTGRDSKFHRIRKSTASHFAKAGGDATALLDHSSTKVTKKYLDNRIVGQQHAADLLKVPQAAEDAVNGKKGGVQ